MQLHELLPMIELMRSQRVHLIGMPQGTHLAHLDKPAMQKRMLGGKNDPENYMQAEIIYVDANNTSINVMVKWPRR